MGQNAPMEPRGWVLRLSGRVGRWRPVGPPPGKTRWEQALVGLGPLIERCRGGDALAWEALVQRFQDRIYGLAFHYVRDAEEARDLAQDVFIRVYEKLDDARAEKFTPWIFRLARNLCIDRLRRRKARPPLDDVQVEAELDLASTDASPEDTWLSNSRTRLVYRAMEHLSPAHREIIVLKEIQGFGLNEISEMLDTPVGTLKSRSHRARIELARRVKSLDPGYARGGER